MLNWFAKLLNRLMNRPGPWGCASNGGRDRVCPDGPIVDGSIGALLRWPSLPTSPRLPMFTGLVQGLGTLQSLGPYQLEIRCADGAIAAIVPTLEIGDSVAVDGVCLTVEVIRDRGFIAAVSPETLSKTVLGHRLEQQQPVNLETSLRVGSKIGGHFVTGHVDGTGELVGAIASATSWELEFLASAAIARYIVPKGSVAINGISLTVATCSESGDRFTVAVIPHTYAETNLSAIAPGEPVNLEGDILGKYVEKLIRQPANPSPRSPESEEPLTLEFLQDHGYL